MNLWIGITDNEWFHFLAGQGQLDEVNFWLPGKGGTFGALSPGEPFLFKLHAPHNYIVGGGFYTHFSRLPTSLAWEAFGEKNGAGSFTELRAMIRRYRRDFVDPDPSIGCVILAQPFFFDEIDWIPIPENFSLNIVRGKAYRVSEDPGLTLWDRVRSLLKMSQPGELAEPEANMFGEPILVRPRLGQGAFRVLVTDTYQRRCAVTQERALPVLEAAHIMPVSGGGRHRIDNGVLLRSDLHRLFDRGYVTITPKCRFRVSTALKKDFDNGELYYPLDGREVWLPKDPACHPQREFLEWHSDTLFRG